MDLQVSVFFLFILFTAGHSFSCYQCPSLSGLCGDQITCSSEVTSCISAGVYYANSTVVTAKDCGLPIGCPSGSISFGLAKIAFTCCSTNLCNSQDTTEPALVPNGKSCYYCDGQSCTNSLVCSGTEDRCFKGTGNIGGQNMVLKGCVSKSISDAASVLDKYVSGVSYCEGNKCNSAESVTQSFLFLCCSLLSFILLH